VKLDSKQQQTFLLEMFKAIQIPGAVIEIAIEVKRAIEKAEIGETVLETRD
jgi:hypothetical protein